MFVIVHQAGGGMGRFPRIKSIRWSQPSLIKGAMREVKIMENANANFPRDSTPKKAANACDERKIFHTFHFSCQKQTFIINFFPKFPLPPLSVGPLLFVKREATKKLILTIVFYLIMLVSLCVCLPNNSLKFLWKEMEMKKKHAGLQAAIKRRKQWVNAGQFLIQ